MNKRQMKKVYPSSCNKCNLYDLVKSLLTNNCCDKCPNREGLENEKRGNDLSIK